MKSTNKKTILFVLIAVISLCMLVLVGCVSNNGSGNGGSSEGSLEESGLYDPTKDGSKQSLSVLPVQTVELGDEITLEANAVNIGDKLYWRSSDESVATVNENGKVTTRNAGEATITVYGGSLSASCKLTVTQTNAVPVVNLDSSEITIGVNSSYIVIVDNVTFKGKIVDITEFKWTCQDESDEIIDVKKNADGSGVEITAKGTGETEIFVSCTYCNNAGVSSVKVKVVDICNVDIKGMEYGGGEYFATVYTTDYNRLGYDFSTVLPFEVNVYKNGIKVDETPAFTVADGSVAKVENGTITGLSEGKTVIYCEYENERKIINVSCERPTVVLSNQTNAVIDRSVSDSLEIIRSEDIVGSIEKVMFRGGENAKFSEAGVYSDGVMTIDKALNSSEMGEGEFKLISENIDYVFDGSIYSMVIDSADKLNELNRISKNGSDKADVYDGYFVLAADLYLPAGYSFNEVAVGVKADGNNGFVGIFDGRSHIISGLSVKNGGLFAVTGNSAVIKNVIFKDASVTDSGFISSAGGGTINNVYIEYKKITVTENCEGFVGTVFVNNGKTQADCIATVTNCVILSHNAIYESYDLSYSRLFILGGTSSVNGVYSNVLTTVKASIKDNRATCYDGKACVNSNDGYITARTTGELGEKLTTFDRKWDKSFWTLDSDACPVPKVLAE